MPFQLSSPGSPGFAIVPSRHLISPVCSSRPTICGPPIFAATPVPVVAFYTDRDEKSTSPT